MITVIHCEAGSRQKGNNDLGTVLFCTSWHMLQTQTKSCVFLPLFNYVLKVVVMEIYRLFSTAIKV